MTVTWRWLWSGAHDQLTFSMTIGRLVQFSLCDVNEAFCTWQHACRVGHQRYRHKPLHAVLVPIPVPVPRVGFKGASHRQRASHQTVQILFLANDRCPRDYYYIQFCYLLVTRPAIYTVSHLMTHNQAEPPGHPPAKSGHASFSEVRSIL